MLMKDSAQSVILVLPKIPWMVVCWQSSRLLVGYGSASVVNTQPNYRIALSPTTGVSGTPLISCCQDDCATEPALKWGNSSSNELWPAVWLWAGFTFPSSFVHASFWCAPCFCSELCKRYFLFKFSPHRQSKGNFKVISDVSTGTVFFPLLTLQSYLL